jgi:hypothetical protein
MYRRCRNQSWRAAVLAAALFAITINFLQPLAHAVLMRIGAPGTWAAMCLPGAPQQTDDHQRPASARTIHDCCLGLGHVPGLAEPPTAFVVVEPTTTRALPLEAAQSLTPVGIRDGPSQPRGPPFPT